MSVQFLELHPQERALRMHIQRQTLEYAQKYITTDHVWYTETGIAEIFSSSLDEISPFAPTDVSFPVDPLEKILSTRELVPYDEQLVLSAAERDGVRSVIAQNLAAFKKGRALSKGLSVMKSEDPNILETPRRPLSPILTSRARHQTPKILHRSKAQIIGMLPTDVEESVGKARIHPIVVEDVQEEHVQAEQYLNIQYTISKDEADELRAFVMVATNKTRKPPSGFADFLRAESPTPPAYFPRPMSPPLFPRSETTNLGAERVEMRLEEAVDLVRAKRTEVEEGFGLDEIAQENMNMLCGNFDILPPSSPPPSLSYHQTDFTSSDAAQPSSPPRTPLRIHQSERAFMVSSSPSKRDVKFAKLDEILFPSDQQRGRKLPPRRDTPKFPDMVSNIQHPVPTRLETDLPPVATILVPGSPSISNDSVIGQADEDEDEEIDELADDNSTVPSRAVSRRTSKRTASRRTISGRSEIDELADDDTLVSVVVDRLTRGVAADPFEIIMKEKLDEREALMLDVPELPPPNVSKIPVEPEPESVSSLIERQEVRRVGGIKSLQIELGWRVTMPGQHVSHDQAANVLNPVDPDTKSMVKQFRAELRGKTPVVFREEQTRESVECIGGGVWRDGMIMTREEREREKMYGTRQPVNEEDLETELQYDRDAQPFATQASFIPLSFSKESQLAVDDYYPSPIAEGPIGEDSLGEYCPSPMMLAQDGEPLVYDSEGDLPPYAQGEEPSEYGQEKMWVDDSGYYDEEMEVVEEEDRYWFQMLDQTQPHEEAVQQDNGTLEEDVEMEPAKPMYAVEEMSGLAENVPRVVESIPRPAKALSKGTADALRATMDLERALVMDFATTEEPVRQTVSQRSHSAQDQLSCFMHVATNAKLPDPMPVSVEPPIDTQEARTLETPALHPIPDEVRPLITLSPDDMDTTSEPEPFRILANMQIMHHRALVNTLEHPSINLHLIERSFSSPSETTFTWTWQDTSTALQGASFVLDPDTALVVIPLAELASPDAVPAVSRLLQSLLTRFEWVGIVLEAYAKPKPRSLQTDIDPLVLNPFTPPALRSLSALRRALALLHNSLGLVPIAGTGGVEVGIGRSVQESAKIVRCVVDRAAASWRAREGREKEVWGMREWVGVEGDESEEQELSNVPRMNVFAAITILAQATVDEVLSLSSEERSRVFGPSVTESKVAALNDVIAQGQARVEMIGHEGAE